MNEARLRKTAWRYVRERGSAHPTIKTQASVLSGVGVDEHGL
jgi:hypothetical protein